MPALPKERLMTTVADVMTRGVRSMSPNDTVVLAAQAMDELNVGVIPVCDGEKLVGMVTDRDIVVRGVAQEADTKTLKLADVMSTNVRCANQDEDIDDVLNQMADTQIRRMPVVDGSSAWWASFLWGTSHPRTRRTRKTWRCRWAIFPRRPSRTDPANRRPAGMPAAAPPPAKPIVLRANRPAIPASEFADGAGLNGPRPAEAAAAGGPRPKNSKGGATNVAPAPLGNVWHVLNLTQVTQKRPDVPTLEHKATAKGFPSATAPASHTAD